MPELIEPTVALHRQWLEHRAEFGPGANLDGSALAVDRDITSPADFAEWVGDLAEMADPSTELAPDLVHATFWWIVEGETVLGSIALRRELNAALLEGGGHIGYSVRPSARRRGVATYALGEVLEKARELGLERVLIVCAVTNDASLRTIQHFGGVQEDVRATARGPMRRLWVAL